MPRGLIAYDIYQPPKPGGTAKPSFASTIFGSSGKFAGVDLAIQWCNLEPRPNRFNWAPIETVMRGAQVGHVRDPGGDPRLRVAPMGVQATRIQYTESSFSYPV